MSRSPSSSGRSAMSHSARRTPSGTPTSRRPSRTSGWATVMVSVVGTRHSLPSSGRSLVRLACRLTASGRRVLPRPVVVLENRHHDRVAPEVAVPVTLAQAPLDHEAEALVEHPGPRVDAQHVERDPVQAEAVGRLPERMREDERDPLAAEPATPLPGAQREAQVGVGVVRVDLVEHDLTKVLVGAPRDGPVLSALPVGDGGAPGVDLSPGGRRGRPGQAPALGVVDHVPHGIGVVRTDGTQDDQLATQHGRVHACLRVAQPWLIRSMTSSRTRPASAWPRVAFITAPMIEPTGPRLPARTWRASWSLRRPESTRRCSSPICSGVTGRAPRSTPSVLAVRASSPIHHLRAAAGVAPAATVVSISSTAPAFTTSRISGSE